MNDLLNFLEKAPTAWHAVAFIEDVLQKDGFIKLEERQSWSLTPGGRYFVIRDNSAITAFILPLNPPKSAYLLASHLDSPALKLKPMPEIRKQNMILFGVEVYGAPLFSSWLNRDLGIAGRVAFEDLNGKWQEKLVDMREHPLVIPQLAIHLDREVNEKGLILNKQEHLNALAALDEDLPSGSYFEKLLETQIEFKEILAHDLFLYPLDPPRRVGYQNQMISSYRIDSLASVHAALQAILKKRESNEDRINMVVFWNAEEIGSNTPQGAASPFISEVLERITLFYQYNREALFQLISRSFCVSIDLAHAMNPNYMEKHDSNHPVLLGKGVVLKNNAQHRYATDMRSARAAHTASKNAEVHLQNFVSRNDIPCGSTIGPIHAGSTGMLTVDIGCGQLSMHSARELMSCKDQESMVSLLNAFLDSNFNIE
jgi:aspartyl aminopeptidase